MRKLRETLAASLNTMDRNRTIEILEALVSGCSPKTGEEVAHDSVLNERDVIRALQIAIDELKIPTVNTVKPNTKQNKSLYKIVDYFTTERFNNLTPEMVNRLKSKVHELGISKTENLSDYVINARTTFPRAYEPWTDSEKELFGTAIKYTNDIDLFSECFQRGKESIEAFGQRLIYDSQTEENRAQDGR